MVDSWLDFWCFACIQIRWKIVQIFVCVSSIYLAHTQHLMRNNLHTRDRRWQQVAFIIGASRSQTWEYFTFVWNSEMKKKKKQKENNSKCSAYMWIHLFHIFLGSRNLSVHRQENHGSMTMEKDCVHARVCVCVSENDKFFSSSSSSAAASASPIAIA